MGTVAKHGRCKKQTGGCARAWRTAAGQVHEGRGGMRSHTFQWSARCSRSGRDDRVDLPMLWTRSKMRSRDAMDGWVRVVCGWRFRESR